MSKALDVANFFLLKVDLDAGDLITQLKLYKLVYYAQAWSLVFLEKPLFDSEIQAWPHGPVPTDLRPLFSVYGSDPIPAPANADVDISSCFNAQELKTLELTWMTYGELSANKLRNLTHVESPWMDARRGLKETEPSTSPICHSDIRDYYASYGSILKNGDFVIDPVATKEDKSFDFWGHVFLKDGESVRTKFTSFEDLHEKYGELEARDAASFL
jgi:uncharacterized phage-associated protein